MTVRGWEAAVPFSFDPRHRVEKRRRRLSASDSPAQAARAIRAASRTRVLASISVNGNVTLPVRSGTISSGSASVRRRFEIYLEPVRSFQLT